MSTYKAKLIVLLDSVQEAIVLQNLAEEILQISDAPTNIYCDNQAVIKSIEADKTKYSTQTKHIGLQCNFIKCYIEEQLINIKYVQTDKQRADILTKSLHVLKIKHFTDLISLVNVWRGLLTCIMIDDTITDDTEMSTHFVMTDNTVLVNNTSRTDTEQWDMYQIHNTRHVPNMQYVSDT